MTSLKFKGVAGHPCEIGFIFVVVVEATCRGDEGLAEFGVGRDGGGETDVRAAGSCCCYEGEEGKDRVLHG